MPCGLRGSLPPFSLQHPLKNISHFMPEDGGTVFLRNIGVCLQVCTESHPVTATCSESIEAYVCGRWLCPASWADLPDKSLCSRHRNKGIAQISSHMWGTSVQLLSLTSDSFQTVIMRWPHVTPSSRLHHFSQSKYCLSNMWLKVTEFCSA